MKYYAAIEAGGTKFNCAVINHDKNIIEQLRVPNTTPEKTLEQVVAFLNQAKQDYSIEALGLASFGPLNLNKSSPDYGNITATPKPNWGNFPISRTLSSTLNLPVFFDTDVNGAILGEYLWGAAQNTRVAVYVTIGTGIGGGIIVNGQILNGLHHPEMGHMLVPTQENQGTCPFHETCLEGLTSGPAIAKKWHQAAEEIKAESQIWHTQAEYIASFCYNLLVTLAPEKIILGGGVMQQDHLLNLVIQKTEEKMANYLDLGKSINEILVNPGLEQQSGIFGALALAQGKGSHCIVNSN